MKKKTIVALLLTLFSLAIATLSFANDDIEGAANSVRNVVGDAENMVEDAGSAVSNGVKGTLNAAGDAVQGAANDIKSGIEDTENKMQDAMNNGKESLTRATTDQNNYDATRTSTGISSTNNVWMWFILGVISLAIVGLVWYYAMQHQTNDFQ